MWLKGVQNHSDVDQIFMILKLVTLNCAECTRGVAKCENGIALVTYQEILNKMKVQMICILEACRN